MKQGVPLKQRPAQAVAVPAPPTVLSPVAALTLPLTFTLLLASLTLLPSVRHQQVLLWSFLGAAAVLAAWAAVLLAGAQATGRRLAVEVSLRKQHYMQACAHLSILLYWGWYWRTVYDSAPLIAAQLAFAYAFDALLSWSRRDTYTFGFGPFPIILSTNLFLWFKPDWFYLQFLMVGVGFAAKEVIRWNKNGRLTHVFNPSSFTLFLFSVILIVTHSTGISWGPDIATTQFNPPHIYLWIFLASLPGQLLFGVAPMTLAAVTTTYTFCVVYFLATGAHYFPEPPIPIAVFLGMHLLFTDPSTSPQTELGRLIFGVLYGLGVVAFAGLLTYMRLPGFYDKLLPVPILNVMIRRIDAVARSDFFKRFDPGAYARRLLPRQRNLAYISVWAIAFATMQASTGAQATLQRADSLVSQGRTEEAIGRYREFLQEKPDDAEAHNDLGVALMRVGRFDEAVGSFQRAIELKPDIPRTQLNLGVSLMRTGRFGEATPLLERAVALEPDNVDAHDDLGQALVQSGRFADALLPLRHVVDLRPSNPDAQEHLGTALMQAGRTQDAIVPLRRAVELAPGSAEAHYNLAHALSTDGQPKAAVGELREALRLHPEWPQAMESLAWLEATERDALDPADAVRLASSAADLGGRRDAHSLDVLAAAYAAGGRFAEASQTAETAEALVPASDPTLAAEIRTHLGVYRSLVSEH